jgi:hypothetical protein
MSSVPALPAPKPDAHLDALLNARIPLLMQNSGPGPRTKASLLFDFCAYIDKLKKTLTYLAAESLPYLIISKRILPEDGANDIMYRLQQLTQLLHFHFLRY